MCWGNFNKPKGWGNFVYGVLLHGSQFANHFMSDCVPTLQVPLTSRSFASKNVPSSRLETCLAPASWTEGGSWGSKQTLASAKRTGQIWTNRTTDLTSTNVPHRGDYKSGVPLTSLLLTVCVQWSHICILLRSCCHIGLTVARSPQDWETAMVIF